MAINDSFITLLINLHSTSSQTVSNTMDFAFLAYKYFDLIQYISSFSGFQ